MDQFDAETELTTDQKMTAYAATTKHFGLRAWQRDLLDVAPQYPWVMRAALGENWERAFDLLVEAGIIAL